MLEDVGWRRRSRELGQKLGWSGKSGSVGGSFLGEVAPTGAASGRLRRGMPSPDHC